MALELQENRLGNVQGKLFADEAIEVNEDGLHKVETKLPAKEKREPKIKIKI